MVSKERFIRINGKEIPVSEDVYFAYKRPAWAERKRREVRTDKERSLEVFMEDGFDIPSDQALVDEIVADKLLLDELYAALAELTDDERSLIDALYFKDQTAREYARKTETNHTNINRHHKSIIEKLRSLLKNHL